MHVDYPYYAFISYNRHDVAEARALHVFLEDYVIPKKFRTNLHKGKSFGKVFFAPENLSYADELTEELKERLRESRYLIVICSPDSAKSKYVGMEIDYFCSIRPKSNVLFYIVRGEPDKNSLDNCYHDVIWDKGLDQKLASDITTRNCTANWFQRELQGLVDDKKAAQFNIAASLLGVKDRTELIDSHKRRICRRNIILSILAVIFFVSILGWYLNKVVNVSFDLNNYAVAEHDLPPLKNGIVTLYLDNDVITEEIKPGNMLASFSNIPKKLLGSEARITFEANGFCPIDKNITLQRNVSLPVQRDSLLYGRVRFKLRDMNMVKVVGCRVCVEGIETFSNEDGTVEIYVPMKNQKTEYLIDCERPLESNRIIAPCTGSEVIFVK